MTTAIRIPFNRPARPAGARRRLDEALTAPALAGNGRFGQLCAEWLERQTGAPRVLLTTSCTNALEMAALLTRAGPGDEVIVPSFTFVTSASAFALRGAVPVWIDIRPDTQNVDVREIAGALSPRTRAIVVVHYAGVACEMDAIRALAAEANVPIVEDAAQGLLASYRARALGTMGRFGTLSFHATKNVQAGEGGALIVNDRGDVDDAEVAWEKGTNRQRFLAGAVDKYTWESLGSSCQPSELVAAYLLAALEEAETVTASRLRAWARYHEALAPLEAGGRLHRPVVPEGCEHNAHIYYVVMESQQDRDGCIAALRKRGIEASFHYVPLHESPAGQRFGRAAGALPNTERAGRCLLRLPLWSGIDGEVDEVVSAVEAYVRGRPPSSGFTFERGLPRPRE